MDISIWNFLPFEIIEKILLDVPTVDMKVNQMWVCKAWTNVLLEPKFWIRKLRNISTTINEDTLNVLNGFERKIQIACLYHACLNEKFVYSEAFFEKFVKLSDNFEDMLKFAGCLITTTVDFVKLVMYKEKMPVLPLLLKLLAVTRPHLIIISDHYGFWNFSPRYEFVQLLRGPHQDANIVQLFGCVSTLDGLVNWQTIRNDQYLMLSIAVDENNNPINPSLYDKRHEIVMMHIRAGTNISAFSKYELWCQTYIISGLDSTHISWMFGLSKILSAHICSYRFILLNCEMDKKSMIQLLHCLHENGSEIQPVEILCSSSLLNANDAEDLNNLAHRLWSDCFCEYFMLFESYQKLIQSDKFQKWLDHFNDREDMQNFFMNDLVLQDV